MTTPIGHQRHFHAFFLRSMRASQFVPVGHAVICELYAPDIAMLPIRDSYTTVF